MSPEQQLIVDILERYPDMHNLRPIGWSSTTVRSRYVGLAVVSRLQFDGWRHFPVRDDEFRRRANKILRGSQRLNDEAPDAVLVFTEIQ